MHFKLWHKCNNGGLLDNKYVWFSINNNIDNLAELYLMVFGRAEGEEGGKYIVCKHKPVICQISDHFFKR